MGRGKGVPLDLKAKIPEIQGRFEGKYSVVKISPEFSEHDFVIAACE